MTRAVGQLSTGERGMTSSAGTVPPPEVRQGSAGDLPVAVPRRTLGGSLAASGGPSGG